MSAPLQITPKVVQSAKVLFKRSGDKFYQLFVRKANEVSMNRHEFEKDICLLNTRTFADKNHASLALLTTSNLELYARFHANLLAKPTPKNRGKNGLFEQAVALQRNSLVNFVFNILLLHAMSEDIFDAICQAQANAERSDFWANDVEDPVAKWEERDAAVHEFLEGDSWGQVVEHALEGQLEELVEAIGECEYEGP